MSKQRPLRVGFDLDSVILYNPARIVRPITTTLKKFLIKKRKLFFYIPKSALGKFFWYLLHKSSIFVAPGYKEMVELVKQGKIEAYIVTARYSFLKNDFERWMKKIEADKYFSGCFLNQENLQPHIFKAEMIERLKLDIYVEDNWDIVQYLRRVLKNKVKIYWIYNILDKHIEYPYKFSELKDAVNSI